jgi:serine protease Do
MKNRPAGLVLALAVFLVYPATAGEVSDVFEKVHTSVVVIETVQQELVPRGQGTMASVGGLGSGVLISADGKVMTAAHVVQTAESVTVTFVTGEVIPARILASEPSADVALLQLEMPPPEAVHKALLGDSDAARVGDQVLVVGAPLGISHTLTVGHLSARRQPTRMMGEFQLAEFLQTDAAINVGNSGGPMFNLEGEVIGLVSHIISQTGGSEGLGFAVSSNTARRLLLESAGVWSGLHGVVLEGQNAAILNLPVPSGLLVQEVAKGSLAEKLGLRPGKVHATIEDEPILLGGDVIIKVMGIPLAAADSHQSIRDKLIGLRKGETIRVTVLRAGRNVELAATKP